MIDSQMAPVPKRFRFEWKAREKRMLVYLAIVLGVAAWKFLPRPWYPTMKLDATHHVIHSTATRPQTEEIARVLEILYHSYSNRLGTLPGFQREHPKMEVKLFKDRKEFRRINPNLGWAEAFYLEPYCRAYYSAEENNPYHWMLHESVHQLNHEVAHLKLEKWLEEGLADYFATCRLRSNSLVLAMIDLDTYPVWWLDEIASSTNLQENIRNKSVIPLRSIITNSGGPNLSRHFNLYYLHWWTLTRFVFEHPKHRDHALDLVQEGGGLPAFERLIGPLEQVQSEWHAYVRDLRARVAPPEREP
jgi:hypothetical protein